MQKVLQVLGPQWPLLMFTASQVTLTGIALSVALVVQCSVAPENTLLQRIVLGLGYNVFSIMVDCVQK